MTKLATFIDGLPLPEFPDALGEDERQMVLLALKSAKQQIRPYDGNFEASWLLTPFEAPLWETTNRGREEWIFEKWNNTIRIDWRVQLHNGSFLTDTRYERLLILLKKISFLSRSELIKGKSVPRAWQNSTNQLLAAARWLVLHEDKFLPEQFGLRLLDQPAFDWLFALLAEGGWSHALQIPQRILSTMYQGAHGVACPKSLLEKHSTLPHDEIPPLVKWLEYQGIYKSAKRGVNHGKRFLSRDALGKLINENPRSLNTTNILRFLRQFEPDFKNASLLIRYLQNTEFPSQKIESIQDIRETLQK